MRFIVREHLVAIPFDLLLQIHHRIGRIRFTLLGSLVTVPLRILCRVLLAFVEVEKGFLVGELLLMLLIVV